MEKSIFHLESLSTDCYSFKPAKGVQQSQYFHNKTCRLGGQKIELWVCYVTVASSCYLDKLKVV